MRKYYVTPSAKNDGIYLTTGAKDKFVRGSVEKATASLVRMLEPVVPGQELLLRATTRAIRDGLLHAAQAAAYPCLIELGTGPNQAPVAEAPAPKQAPKQATAAPAEGGVCGKCGGAGGGVHSSWLQYDEGRCFACHGTGKAKPEDKDLRAAARAESRRYSLNRTAYDSYGGRMQLSQGEAVHRHFINRGLYR